MTLTVHRATNKVNSICVQLIIVMNTNNNTKNNQTAAIRNRDKIGIYCWARFQLLASFCDAPLNSQTIKFVKSDHKFDFFIRRDKNSFVTIADIQISSNFANLLAQ